MRALCRKSPAQRIYIFNEVGHSSISYLIYTKASVKNYLASIIYRYVCLDSMAAHLHEKGQVPKARRRSQGKYLNELDLLLDTLLCTQLKSNGPKILLHQRLQTFLISHAEKSCLKKYT